MQLCVLYSIQDRNQTRCSDALLTYSRRFLALNAISEI